MESFPEVGQLYPTKDLDFRPQAGRTAIGTLVTCAITSMRQAMPQAMPVRVVANWNARSQGMNNEMMEAKLCPAAEQCATSLKSLLIIPTPGTCASIISLARLRCRCRNVCSKRTCTMRCRDLAPWLLRNSRTMSACSATTHSCAELCTRGPAPSA